MKSGAEEYPVFGEDADATGDYCIFIVSDGTGETAANLIRALITQFSAVKGIYIRRFPKVVTTDAVDKVLASALKRQGPVMIAYTLVNSSVRSYLKSKIEETRLEGYDLFSSLLSKLISFLGSQPDETPDKFHGFNEAYFKRIEALEFTLKHDDGKHLKGMHEADVVLVGVSRTGKTPLSIYLSHYGLKVINVPLARGLQPPALLFTIDQGKIVGLTIDPNRLLDIRKRRLTGMSAVENEYAHPLAIMEEVEEAELIFQKNPLWPLIDVTCRSIEETATMVRDRIFGRDRLVN